MDPYLKDKSLFPDFKHFEEIAEKNIAKCHFALHLMFINCGEDVEEAISLVRGYYEEPSGLRSASLDCEAFETLLLEYADKKSCKHIQLTTHDINYRHMLLIEPAMKVACLPFLEGEDLPSRWEDYFSFPHEKSEYKYLPSFFEKHLKIK